MGGKNSAKRKGKKSGKPQQGQARSGSSAGNDFRGAGFAGSQVLGHGTMTANTYVQQYAPVPTALDALPQPPVGFTGREEDLTYILDVLDPDRSDQGPAVAVLSGGGGVGKTTLAYAAGHAAQRSGWFTGVLLVDLHGYDPQPAQAEEALEALLRSLGVPHEHLPPPGAGREALYRSQLNARQEKGERLLVVADNASAIAQVQPLVPPGHHGMLVTSRHRLTGLGRMRTVNRLQPEDAVALLEAALKNNDPDDPRVGEDPAAAERLASACGYLPLALQITAALLAQDPGQPLSERADALGGTESVLDGLDDGDRSLRTMFDQSLERLTPQEQDLFRLLALNPGPNISTPAAAVLADQPQPATERLLARLAASHLIERTPTVRGRWQMHDLLRAYAHEQATAVMDRGRAPRRRYDQARDRLIHHYIQHAQAASTHLDPPRSPVPARFTDRDQALEWFDAERENLIATAHTTPQAALHLSSALGSYLKWRRHLQDHVVVNALALDACTKLNDTRNKATVWNNLGGALLEFRRFEDAVHALETARDLHQQTGNTQREATAWNNLGGALQELRRFDDALHALETARDLYQQNGDTNGVADAWNNLGTALQDLRRFDDALHALETARDLHQQTGNTHGEATAWNNLGNTYQELRRFDDALHALETARDLHQQNGNAHGEATAWNNLGNTYQELRRFDDALHAHQTARCLDQKTGDTNGEAIAWNNIGTAYRGLGRVDEAVVAGKQAVAMLAAERDWFLTGEAWGELATTLTAAGVDTAQVHDAWEQSAQAYTEAGADEEAAASQEHANSTETVEAQLPAVTDLPEKDAASESG
ncbi:ATP-binding protein [Streptomyces globisporus]|uniref:ATP-binding protein n=1 Tax=Streptomyces globisporus TaxID=1908 RepID=UPI0037A040F0